MLNGQSTSLPDAPSLADALRAAGIGLPALCHDERLAPSGACRLCLVRVGDAEKPVPACATPLTEGMRVETSAPDLEHARRGTLEMLASRYPADPVYVDPHKPFHQAIASWQLEGALSREGTSLPRDRSHPYIAVDMSRCIRCERCVRICSEVQGQFVWHVRERGAEIHIEPDGPDLLRSSCVSCGACVDTCPTGALEDATFDPLTQPFTWTRTVCPYCGTGCELSVGTRDERIVSIKPARHSPVSHGHLCVKGRYAFEFVAAPDRITEPMIRDHSGWLPVSWDEALAFAANGLRQAVALHGRDAAGVLASARQTNEENYLAQKFARLVLGTNNVDCCARVCHAPSSTALKAAFGAGLSTNSFDDIERAQAILVCGANPTENHPIVGARIKQAVRRRAARLIVIDPRRIELAEYADCFLQLRPGTNIPLLNAMAHVIIEEHLVDRTFLDDRVSGFAAYADGVATWTPERAAEVCGIDPADIRAAARLYASNAPAMIFNGLGVTEHVQGTDGETALINLALLTGNIGRPGAGVNPLRGQNNVQGAAHMGCEPSTLPGGVPLALGRGAFEGVWKAAIPQNPGIDEIQMLGGDTSPAVRALWVIGYDVALTNPNAAATASALASMDFVVVQDLFMTETARRYGSVFLPACSSFEKDGTFMNAERRVQRVHRALRPVGNARPDWQIISGLARAMGHPEGFEFDGPEAIWNELRAACSGARGMSYARLDGRGLQWPCPDDAHPGTPLLHAGQFTSGRKAPLTPVDFRPTPEAVSPAFPFLLNTGRSLLGFNAGTMTGRGRTHDFRPSDLLDISPFDAADAQIDEGALVRVTSRYGSAVLPARISGSVRPGELFATFQTPAVFLNAVTGRGVDARTHTPEYKVTAVRIERVRT